MDFMYKRAVSSTYQLKFTPRSLCLSSSAKYCAAIIFGQCVSWCEGDIKNLDLSLPVYAEIHDYKVLANLNCWDLLAIFESEFNRTEELLDLCYENELSGDKNDE